MCRLGSSHCSPRASSGWDSMEKRKQPNNTNISKRHQTSPSPMPQRSHAVATPRLHLTTASGISPSGDGVKIGSMAPREHLDVSTSPTLSRRHVLNDGGRWVLLWDGNWIVREAPSALSAQRESGRSWSRARARMGRRCLSGYQGPAISCPVGG